MFLIHSKPWLLHACANFQLMKSGILWDYHTTLRQVHLRKVARPSWIIRILTLIPCRMALLRLRMLMLPALGNGIKFLFSLATENSPGMNSRAYDVCLILLTHLACIISPMMMLVRWAVRILRHIYGIMARTQSKN